QADAGGRLGRARPGGAGRAGPDRTEAALGLVHAAVQERLPERAARVRGRHRRPGGESVACTRELEQLAAGRSVRGVDAQRQAGPTGGAVMTQTFADPAASIRLAAAPISWGVCEVPGWGRVLEPPKVLGEMAELGLSATELGPPGYLPDDPSALLRQFGLSLVGGFLATPLHVSVDEAVAAAERSAKQLSAGGAEVLVLAAATGLTGYDERPELTDEQWNTLIRSADAVAEVAAGYGLRTVLHPHVGTYVETEPEVERFLRDSSLPLCVDSGHLMIGGTDPVRLVQQHADRVGHVHLKDVRAAVAERVRAGELTYTAAISQGLYAPLGDGDVDIAEMIRVLCSADYRGWYVLEQDTALPEDETGDVDRPKVDTERSMRYLKSIIGTSHR